MVEFKDKIKIQENIKSSYIIKEVFSYIKEKKKLNMIIHNKQLQKIIGVDIEDYKKIEGKYKTGLKNGKGKEYLLNTKILIFEGEYLNGKRKGKGKEYYNNGNLKFEGEYLNDKIWNGKVEEYGNFGLLIFKGEYLNGERNGKGREYHDGSELLFEGEYLNGKRNGKGKEYFNNGNLKFEGEYLNGKIWNGKGYNIDGILEFEIKEGKGTIKIYDYYEGKLLFEGEYLNGERNGKGKEYYSDDILIFEGEYLNGERNGYGKEYYLNNKILFEGEYLNGKLWNGKGYNIDDILEFEIKEGKGTIKNMIILRVNYYLKENI